MKNVRALAARALRDAETSFIDAALDGHRTAALSRRDRALLTTLGVASRSAQLTQTGRQSSHTLVDVGFRASE